MAEGGEVSRGSPAQERAKIVDEQELERLAVESLLEDVRRRKSRVERVGPMGWVKERNVNKRFLNSLVLQTVRHHVTGRGDRLGQMSSDDNSRERTQTTPPERPGDGSRESGPAGAKRRRVGKSSWRSDPEKSREETHPHSRSRHYHRNKHSEGEHAPHHQSREKPRGRESKDTH